MAIPQGRLSTTLVEGNFLAPDNLEKGGLTDYEMGPIDINDTTQGLLYQVWTATWDPNTANFGVVSDDGKVYSSIHNAVDVTHVSFCFDQNGRPTIAYVSESIPYLYWYDTQQSETTITPLDYTIRTPFLTLDDKRATQSQSNDILLFYTKPVPSTAIFDLYMLRQRDRFATEILLETSTPPYIHKVGMTDQLRLQVGMTYVPPGEVGLLVRSTLGSMTITAYDTDINAIRNLVSTLDTFTFIEHRQIVIKPGDIVSVGGALVITEHQSNVNWIKNVISTYESAAFVEYLSKITPTSLVSLPDTLTLSEHDSIARAYIDLYVTSDYDTSTLTAYDSRVTDPSDVQLISNRDFLFFYRWQTVISASKYIVSNQEQLVITGYDSKVTPLSILTKNYGIKTLTSYDSLIIQYLNQIVSTYDTLTATTYRAIIGYGSNFSNFVPVTLTPHDATVTGTTIYRINSDYETKTIMAYDSDYAGLVFYKISGGLIAYLPLDDGDENYPTDEVGTYTWAPRQYLDSDASRTLDEGLFGFNTATYFVNDDLTVDPGAVGDDNESFSLSWWTKVGTTSAYYYMGQGTYFNHRWRVYSTSGTIRLEIVDNGNTTHTVNSGVGESSIVGTWAHFFITYDHETDTASMSINGAAPVTTSGIASIRTGNNTFYIGTTEGQNESDYSVCEVGIWRGAALSEDDGLWLYNSGAGRRYKEILAKEEGVATIGIFPYKSIVVQHPKSLIDNLTLYMELDDAPEHAPTDRIGNYNFYLEDQQDYDAVTPVEGLHGTDSATYFGSANTYSTWDIPRLFNTSTPCTISAWFYTTQANAYYVFGQGQYDFFNNYDEWRIRVLNNDEVSIDVQDGTGQNIRTFSNFTHSNSAPKWTHVFITWDPVSPRVTINVDNTGNVYKSIRGVNPNGRDLVNLGEAGGWNLPGRIDEFAVWEGVILPDYIQEWLYNGGAGRRYEEIRSYRYGTVSLTLVPFDSTVTFEPQDATYKMMSYLPLYEGDVTNPTDEVGTYTWVKITTGTSYTKTDGLFGEDTATHFNGSSYGIPNGTAPLVLQNTESATMSVWFRIESAIEQLPFGQGAYTSDRWTFRIAGNNRVYFNYRDNYTGFADDIDTGITVTTGQWNHAYVIWNHYTNELSISVNNSAPITEFNINQQGSMFNNNITIGQGFGFGANLSMAEAVIWKGHAYDDAFGTWLYNSGSGRSWYGIQAYPGNGILSNRGVQALTAFDSLVGQTEAIVSDFDTLTLTKYDSLVGQTEAIVSDFDTLTLTAFDSVVTGGSGGGSLLDESGSAILDETNNPILEE